MRGQVSDCICCTQGSFAACGRRVSFPAMGKKPKDRRGTAQDGHFVSIFALPPVPHYGGRVLVRFCSISGAQNLSGDLRFLPGHWALASPKFQSVRFLFRAWLYRANAPSAHTAVGATLAVALSLPLWGKVPSEARRMRSVGAAHLDRPRAGQCPPPTKKKEPLSVSP